MASPVTGEACPAKLAERRRTTSSQKPECDSLVTNGGVDGLQVSRPTIGFCAGILYRRDLRMKVGEVHHRVAWLSASAKVAASR